VSGGEPILQQPPSWPPGLCSKILSVAHALFVSLYLLCALNQKRKRKTAHFIRTR